VIAAVGDERGKFRLQSLESLPHVEKVVPILQPIQAGGREAHEEDTRVRVGPGDDGGGRFCVIAGPCSVGVARADSSRRPTPSSRPVRPSCAAAPTSANVSLRLPGSRGRRTRTAERGVREVRMPFVTEVMTIEQVNLVAEYGPTCSRSAARNMQNFNHCSRAWAGPRKPVLLKRGMMSDHQRTADVGRIHLVRRRRDVVLCERGIRTFETETRNTLDISAVPRAQETLRTCGICRSKSWHRPLGPRHTHGQSRCGCGGGWAADRGSSRGLKKLFSDGAQSLKPARFLKLMKEIEPLVHLAGKTLLRLPYA